MRAPKARCHLGDYATSKPQKNADERHPEFRMPDATRLTKQVRDPRIMWTEAARGNERVLHP